MAISLESDYTGAKFYYQMPFISSSELCSRIKALYRKTLHLNNPFHKFKITKRGEKNVPMNQGKACIIIKDD